MSMSEYALYMAKQASYLQPPMSEMEIIRVLKTRSPTHGTEKVLARRVAFAGVTSDAVPAHGNDGIVARACRERSRHACRARSRAYARVLARARHRVAKAT